jgi:hypothetical protein
MESHIKRASQLTTLLDSKFNFLGVKFGLDPLLNFIPGMGNVIGVLTSFYLIWIAIKINLPKNVFVRMVANVILDFLFGSVPVAGVVFDAFYKANIRNLKLVEDYYYHQKVS